MDADNTIKQMLDRWVAAQLLTQTQATQINQFESERETRDGRKRLITTVATVGALLVGLGVILWVASNWQVIDPSTKLIALIILLLTVYGTAYQLRDRTQAMPRFGAALYFLGSLIFGASIFLVGQAYNLSAGSGTGFLLWALGTYPLAVVTRLNGPYFTSLVVMIVWYFYRLSTTGDSLAGSGAGDFGVPLVSWLTPVLLSGLYLSAAYRIRNAAMLGIYLLGIGFWFGGEIAFRSESANVAFLLAAIFAALISVVGVDHAARPTAPVGFASIYLVLASLVTSLLLFIGTFDIYGYGYDFSWPSDWFVTLLASLLVIALAGLVARQFMQTRDRFSRNYTMVVLVAPAIFALGLLFMQNAADASSSGMLILTNFGLLGVTLGTLAYGVMAQRPDLARLSIAFLVLHIFARYFDLFYDFIDRSLFFILGGLLLLLIGWVLERNRQKLFVKPAEAVVIAPVVATQSFPRGEQ